MLERHRDVLDAALDLILCRARIGCELEGMASVGVLEALYPTSPSLDDVLMCCGEVSSRKIFLTSRFQNSYREIWVYTPSLRLYF